MYATSDKLFADLPPEERALFTEFILSELNGPRREAVRRYVDFIIKEDRTDPSTQVCLQYISDSKLSEYLGIFVIVELYLDSGHVGLSIANADGHSDWFNGLFDKKLFLSSAVIKEEDVLVAQAAWDA